MARKLDRRVQRTQRFLREALFSLIQEKGFEALSVQDIIDRANVGRATFYAHFDNKEDLLLSGLDELRASLKARQREAFASGKTVEERVFAFTREMFAHTNEHRTLFRAMAGKESGATLQRLWRKMLLELVREEERALIPNKVRNPVPDDAFVEFLAGGLFGLLMWWLEGNARPSVEEVNTIFRRLAIPVVKARLR